MKPVQYFSADYLEQSRKMSLRGILEYLEGFRRLNGAGPLKSRSKLISLKIDEGLLDQFKRRATLEGKKYQSLIKELMKSYLSR